MAAADGEVVDHLLFHKSLLDPEDDPDRIDEYLDMVEESTDGEHVSIEDPVDRAISVAFELAIDEHLDPWSIDLARFSSMYLERVRDDEVADLVTAGRLVFMAWRILKMQSESVRDQAEPDPEPEETWDDGWEAIDDHQWMVDDADYDYTTQVQEAEEPPIEEQVRRDGERKVTLYELVGALEEARREAERRTLLEEKKEEAREEREEQTAEPESVAHEEDQEAAIEEVWRRLQRFNGSPVPLSSLRDPNRDDLVRTFTSVLFLARERRVDLWQEEFPHGMIYVENLEADGEGPDTEVRANGAGSNGAGSNGAGSNGAEPEEGSEDGA
jgi:segregation and condensation protein A